MKTVIYSENGGWFENKGLYVFDKPIKTVKLFYNKLLINDYKIDTKKPIQLIEKILKKNKYFALGYISYDFKENIFGKFPKKDDIRVPVLYLSFYKNFKKINLPEEKKYRSVIRSINIPVKEEDFVKKVLKAKEYIEKGDIYQVNISHRIEIDGFFSPENIFYRLIKIQPTPYLMLIKDRDFSIISGSMELFLEKKGRVVKSKPIKGTRKRGRDKKEDKILYNELKNSEKERAENLMITDLMRNDINKIATDVKVENLFSIEEYSSIFQMVSTVKGKLKEGISLKDIIWNTFPPGSVTGAPKKRAIEIIDELEDVKRTVYCGATFLIKPDLDFVMSVAIRQMIFKGNRCYIYVGSGIVADSDPEKEYEETLIKAKANIDSL